MKVPEKLEEITLEWFNSIFLVHKIKVHSFILAGDLSNGRGWLGSLEDVKLEISRIAPNGEVDEKRERVDIVLKTLPRDESRKAFAAQDGCCSREVCMYTEILKVWDDFLDDLKIPQENRFHHPVCYYGAEEGERDSYRYILVLENLLSRKLPHPPDQFHLWEPGYFTPLPQQAVETVIRQIARLHATGIAYKRHRNINYTSKFKQLNHVVDEMLPIMWKNGFDETKELIKETISETEIPGGVFEQIDRLKSEEAMQTFVKWFTDSSVFDGEEQATICHHDLHSENLVLNEDYSKTILFDFQGILVFNPMMDLSYFLILNCDYDISHKNLPKAFQVYHEEFTKFCKAVNCDFQYSLETMQKDYDKFLAFSLTHVLIGAPVRLKGEGSTVQSKRRFAMHVVDAFKRGLLKFPEVPR